jgi:cyclopropane fatty-acyl-phospholipid synthase-like methyltransferase
MTEFRNRDPALAAFWDERFEAGFTPWDAGAAPPGLLRFLQRASAPHARSSLPFAALVPGASVLIPGCGSGWEAGALDDAGFKVLAIDFAAAAIARAGARLGARGDRLLRRADFFDFEPPAIDWIYERTFLPALAPARWPAWAERVAQLLAPDALLAGFFLIDAAADAASRRGPPFPIRRDELDALLSSHFECVEQESIPAAESVAVLAGREQWLTWRRR